MATKRDLHVALGIVPATGDSGDSDMDDGDSSETDSEQEEDDAIDAVFDAKDPAARREAFRRAVQLCAKSY